MAKKKKQYTGCISSIERARDFARESFVYGLKHKNDYLSMSPHTHENATRQMGDWFHECLQTKTIKVRHKVKYLSLNSRDYAQNPLNRIWKACSFTTNEIVFFFFIIDYMTLNVEPVYFSLLYDEYYRFHRSDGFSKSAAQKWIDNKGLPSGIIEKHGRGKYRLAPIYDMSEFSDFLFFYSEISPVGVIGSFILDKSIKHESPFGFKQHYIGQIFDCEVLCNILHAIKRHLELKISYLGKSKANADQNVIPVKVFSSTQNGRQYLIAWEKEKNCYSSFRLDKVINVVISDDASLYFDSIQKAFDNMRSHMWGVSLGNGEIHHVEFLIRVSENESYIINRLYREKRCGKVAPVENMPGIFRFQADVYDPHEMFPWIRTFICRIVELKISDNRLEELFWSTVQEMYVVYDIESEQS